MAKDSDNTCKNDHCATHQKNHRSGSDSMLTGKIRKGYNKAKYNKDLSNSLGCLVNYGLINTGELLHNSDQYFDRDDHTEDSETVNSASANSLNCK